MAGQYAPAPEEAYEKTEGECVNYLQLKAGNHYAIVDWNPDTAPHQVRMLSTLQLFMTFV